jgi:hypothetical protein
MTDHHQYQADKTSSQAPVLSSSEEHSLRKRNVSPAGTETQVAVNGETQDVVSTSRQLVVQRRRTSDPRRISISRGFQLLGALISALTLGYLFSPEPSISPTDYAARAKHVMSTTPLIDGHNDLPYLIRVETKNHIYDSRFTFKEGLLSPTDIVKLRKGRVGGQFWSAYVPCVNDVGDQFDTPTVPLPNLMSAEPC